MLRYIRRISDGGAAMIVVTRNGRTTVITGWRAWLIGAVVSIAATVILAGVALVVLGATLTITTVVLLIAPVIIGVAILASLFRPAERR
jgi:hypothetical protein